VRKVFTCGVGMTKFGKQPGRGLRDMSLAAIDEAIADSGIKDSQIERIYFGNAIAPTVLQQDMIKGQVALRGHSLAHLPLMNIENACASGGSAFLMAVEAVASGCVDVALAVGVEQMHHADKSRAFNALRGSTDAEDLGEYLPGEISANSLLMDFYAGVAQKYLANTDAEVSDFAAVAVKNRMHASHNPLAQLRTPQTIEDVLGGRMIVPPLTLAMCSPITDGAAAALVCSEKVAASLGVSRISVRACQMASGAGGKPVNDASQKAYDFASVGPDDFDLLELHDAAAPAELMQYHEIGLCPVGEGFRLVRDGATALGGRIPVNCSGGLLSRGHALGATGLAQIYELVTQLRGRANGRQVDSARLGMSINGGGWLDGAYALAIATILEKQD
jgi:acetyl-CoA acyltransferase